MPASRRGSLLLLALATLWAAGGYAFYRLDRWHAEREFGLLLDLIRHKATLAESVDSPRVIIAGGSNAYYGLHTKVFEERLGMPAVNVALPFGAHHLRINMAILKNIARPGDVVVFADADFWHGAHKVAWQIRRTRGFDDYLVESRYPGYTRRFAAPGLPWLALPATNSLVLDAAESLSPPKGRSWVPDTDVRGNYTGCEPAPVVKPEAFGSEEPDGDLVAAVRSAAAQFRARGVRLVVNLPWVFIRERERQRWIDFRARFLRTYEPIVPVIAGGPDVIFRTARGEFCDSPFHLMTETGKHRSARVADALRPFVTTRVTKAN